MNVHANDALKAKQKQLSDRARGGTDANGKRLEPLNAQEKRELARLNGDEKRRATQQAKLEKASAKLEEKRVENVKKNGPKIVKKLRAQAARRRAESKDLASKMNTGSRREREKKYNRWLASLGKDLAAEIEANAVEAEHKRELEKDAKKKDEANGKKKKEKVDPPGDPNPADPPEEADPEGCPEDYAKCCNCPPWHECTCMSVISRPKGKGKPPDPGAGSGGPIMMPEGTKTDLPPAPPPPPPSEVVVEDDKTVQTGPRHYFWPPPSPPPCPCKDLETRLAGLRALAVTLMWAWDRLSSKINAGAKHFMGLDGVNAQDYKTLRAKQQIPAALENRRRRTGEGARIRTAIAWARDHKNALSPLHAVLMGLQSFGEDGAQQAHDLADKLAFGNGYVSYLVQNGQCDCTLLDQWFQFADHEYQRLLQLFLRLRNYLIAEAIAEHVILHGSDYALPPSRRGEYDEWVDAAEALWGHFRELWSDKSELPPHDKMELRAEEELAALAKAEAEWLYSTIYNGVATIERQDIRRISLAHVSGREWGISSLIIPVGLAFAGSLADVVGQIPTSKVAKDFAESIAEKTAQKQLKKAFEEGMPAPKPNTRPSSMPPGPPTGPPFDWKHILDGDTSGFHSRPGGIDPPSARVISKGPPDSHGVYEAKVEITNPATGQVKTKNSTFFPDDWTHERVKAEVEGAFDKRVYPDSAKPEKWTGTSPSGVRIDGYDNPARTTAYPVRR